MTHIKPTHAEEIGRAAMAFQRECTGVTPKSVTVLLGESTLVVTLHGAYSLAEIEMARKPEGAARVHEFHRRLFETAALALHGEFKRIIEVDVSASTLELDSNCGRLVEFFPSGDIIQVFRLSRRVPTESWRSPGGVESPKTPVAA